MKDVYYWYDKVPDDVNLNNYSSLEDLLETLKYSALDKWSYISSKEDDYNYFEEGQYIGIGIKLKYDDDNNVRISLVYKNSPAYNAKLQRGDIILSINGKSVDEIENQNLWSSIFGEDKEGVEVNLTVKKLNGNIENLSLKKDIVNINSVYLTKIFEIDNKKIGYLVFLTFIEPSYDELKQAFKTFKEEGIDELVLDLRYNTGGRLHIADELASLITVNEDSLFLKFLYNDKYSEYNFYYKLYTLDESLGLNRVVVLTTSSTCSASESVINGLKPYVDVITIGSTSCGKPVGMNPVKFCDKVMSAITFEVKNALDEGEYFNGILPVCKANDDLNVSLGDLNESMLKEAVYYLVNDKCSTTILAKKIRPVFHEKKININGLKSQINAF
jgi:C-terminal peptidase prc